MGCTSTNGQRPNLKVGSLNFSGICLSPFEFHDNSVEKERISAKFNELLNQELEAQRQQQREEENGAGEVRRDRPRQRNFNREQFQFRVGGLDKDYQKERYTPMYNMNAGVEGGKLITIRQFRQQWEKSYNRIQPDVRRRKQAKHQASQSSKSISQLTSKQKQQQQLARTITEQMEQQKNECLMFDTLCYKTILHVVYHTINLDEVKSLDVKEYQKFMQRWFSKEYIDNDIKMEIVAKYIKRMGIDVMFLQESKRSGKKTWQDLLGSGYTVVQQKDNESVIIYLNRKFQKQDLVFSKEYEETLNFNQDSVFVKLGCFILISVHLTSKKEENKKQAKGMLHELSKLNQQRGQQLQQWRVIVGGDTISFIEDNQFKEYSTKFQRFPYRRSDITTCKKRTAMQVQTLKSNMVDVECKDSILTTQKIYDSEVVSINSSDKETNLCRATSWKHSFLPNDEHPFDHYVIYTEIEIR